MAYTTGHRSVHMNHMTMGHGQGCDWLLLDGMICTCDQCIPIGYCSNLQGLTT